MNTIIDVDVENLYGKSIEGFWIKSEQEYANDRLIRVWGKRSIWHDEIIAFEVILSDNGDMRWNGGEIESQRIVKREILYWWNWDKFVWIEYIDLFDSPFEYSISIYSTLKTE